MTAVRSQESRSSPSAGSQSPGPSSTTVSTGSMHWTCVSPPCFCLPGCGPCTGYPPNTANGFPPPRCFTKWEISSTEPDATGTRTTSFRTLKFWDTHRNSAASSRPTIEDGPMKAIDPGDRAEVQKAILLLRLARSLNLGRSRAVQKVRVGVRAAEVRLTLVPRRRMGVDLELWAIEKDCTYFGEIFGRELSTAVA